MIFREHTEILKALADDNRLRILAFIDKEEKCVCDIQNHTQLSQPNVSRHLAKLRSARILDSKKTAQWVHYFLDKKTLEKYPFIITLIEELNAAKKA